MNSLLVVSCLVFAVSARECKMLTLLDDVPGGLICDALLGGALDPIESPCESWQCWQSPFGLAVCSSCQLGVDSKGFSSVTCGTDAGIKAHCSELESCGINHVPEPLSSDTLDSSSDESDNASDSEPGNVKPRFDLPLSIGQVNCEPAEKVTGPTLIVATKLVELDNFFHFISSMFNVYRVVRAFKLQKFHVVFTHGNDALIQANTARQMRELFPQMLSFRFMSSSTCLILEETLIVAHTSLEPIWAGDEDNIGLTAWDGACAAHPVVREYSQIWRRAMHAHWPQHRTSPKVTFIDRKPTEDDSELRNRQQDTDRMIRNMVDVRQMLRGLAGAQADVVAFETMSMKKQVQVAAQTDVLVRSIRILLAAVHCLPWLDPVAEPACR